MADAESIKDGLRAAFRDYRIDGVPASGANDPDKAEIRPALLASVDLAQEAKDLAGQAGTTFAVETVADLSSLSPTKVGDRAEVRNDPAGDVEDGNGVYSWDGSGWVWLSDLIPASVQSALNEVTGLIQPTPAAIDPIIFAVTDEAGLIHSSVRASGTERHRLYDITPDCPGRFVVTDPKGFVMGDLITPQAVAAYGSGLLPARVILDGDSRSDLCTNPGRTRAQGWLFWAQTLLGGRFDVRDAWNNGVGGQDSQEMLDRVSNLAAFVPSLVICICSTNDRTGAGKTAAWSIERLAAYQAAVLAMGHRLLWIAETPRGDTANPNYDMSATQTAYAMQVHQWQLDQAGVAGVSVADPYSLMADPTRTDGRALDTMLRDGIHWGAYGAYYVAQPVITALRDAFLPRPVLPVSNADVYGANNTTGALNPNPMMAGMGGTAGSGCSGSVATGWTAAAGAGLTGVLSKVMTNGKDWQQIVVSGGPTGSASADSLSNVDPRPVSVILSADLTGIAVGDTIDAVCEVEVDAGASGLRSVGLWLEITTASGSTLYAAGEPDLTRSQINLDLPPVAWSGVLRCHPSDVVSGAVTSAKLFLAVTGANFSSSAQPLSATVRVRAVKARKL